MDKVFTRVDHETGQAVNKIQVDLKDLLATSSGDHFSECLRM